MTINSASLRDWLRAERMVNFLYQAMMTLRYDLDGAIDADQVGLAWRTQEDLLRIGIELHLCLSGVRLPVRQDDDRLDRGLRVMDALERTDPARAAEAWRLWLRPVPPADRLADEIDLTLSFLEQRLGYTWVRSRRDTVLVWVSNTELLRAVARELGVAQSDDWYVSAADTGGSKGNWYTEVLASLEGEDEKRSA